jgi:hypothetical protein
VKKVHQITALRCKELCTVSIRSLLSPLSTLLPLLSSLLPLFFSVYFFFFFIFAWKSFL